MMRFSFAVAAFAMVLPLASAAQTDQAARDLCERRAKSETGYSGSRLPEFKVGPFTAKISGSVAVGVSRSSGTSPRSKNPEGGAYAREQFEEKRYQEYENALKRCLAAQ